MSIAGASASAPSSAAVLEFICLFTKDLRRKQKRWEDGRLKFHTFNNRVMVYDDRGSFVGDMHWRRDYDFGEGEEIELERGGTIVQVQDLVHRTEQDLSELIDKRAKEKEQRQLQAVARARGPTSVLPQSMPQSTPRPVPADHFQLRHRPLHQLIGTPSGHHGRALVPPESPYESRQQDADSPDNRAAKRRKYEDERPAKKGHAQALFGQTLNLSATPMSSIPARHQPRKDPSSSVSADEDQRDARQHHENALKEQPKSSLCFNQEKAKRNRESVVTKTTSSNVTSASTKDRSDNLAPLPRLKHTIIPANAEVIDVDDPDPPAASDPPIPRPEPERRKLLKKLVKADAHPKPCLSKKSSSRKALPQSLPASVEHQKSLMTGIEEDFQPVIANSAAVRAAYIEASRGRGETLDSGETSRKSDKPMIELRLKSKKKRGLLMMSDRPEALPSSKTSSAAAQTSEEADGVVIVDRSTPRTTPGQRNKVSRTGEGPAVLDVSLELGEEDDPFRSPSPQLQEQRSAIECQPGLRNDQNAENAEPSEAETDTDAHFGADSVTIVEESVACHDDVLERNKVQGLAAQGHKDDPYRLSSSSPEPCFPPQRAGMSTDDSSLPVNAHVAEEFGHSEAEVVAGPMRNRKARRNIVLDDDESEILFKSTKWQHSVDGETVALDSGSEDAPPKQANIPAKAVRHRKRKPSTQKESEFDEDEEQPRKRRTSTRKTRRPRVSSESSSESKEEQSDREKSARRSRNKVDPVFEERPRLTRVKKSVKSRELIGFDLSALNVPLGPRGVGLPFSILSSSTDVSSQRKASQNAIIPEPTFNAGLDNDEQQMQFDAPKAPSVSMKETSKVSAPIPSPKKINVEQSDPKLHTSEAVADSDLSGRDLQRPRVVTQPKPSPCQGRPPQNQDAATETAEPQYCEKKIDAHQLQDTRTTDWLPEECPEDHPPPLIDVSVHVSRQSGASDLAREPSSIKQVSELPARKSLEEQPPARSLQYEPAIAEPRIKGDEKQTNSSTMKAAAQDPTLLPRSDSKISESAATGVNASITRESDPLEVKQATSATVRPAQPRRTVGLRRTASAVRSINNLQTETPSVEATESTITAEDNTKPIARIANPATRGRKAALKSHAAGQAPQRILPPTQLPLLVPISTADLALTPIEEPKKETERAKKKMRFPGFQSARGEGPWSREAFDLLETGRPG